MFGSTWKLFIGQKKKLHVREKDIEAETKEKRD